MLPLSILDLLPVAADATPSQVIRESVNLAQRADALGYTRYWIAEHHNMPSIAASAPEVLIAHLAAHTSRIRVGAGGIMLPNHTPLRVVEIFRTLEALHPGRIDLGLGRAPGTDPVTAAALRRGAADDPNERLAELLAFERGEFSERHPFHTIVPMPSDVALPPIWMLGSTMTGAVIAASLGLRYAFAGHFAMRNAKAAIDLYRSRFPAASARSGRGSDPTKAVLAGDSRRESPTARQAHDLGEPYPMLAVTVVCGEDDEHAMRMAAPIRLAIVRNRTGQRQPIAGIEEALAYRFSPEEQAIADEFLDGAVIGGPDTVRAGLQRLAAETGASELMLSGLLPNQQERIRSYERVMEAMRP